MRMNQVCTFDVYAEHHDVYTAHECISIVYLHQLCTYKGYTGHHDVYTAHEYTRVNTHAIHTYMLSHVQTYKNTNT